MLFSLGVRCNRFSDSVLMSLKLSGDPKSISEMDEISLGFSGIIICSVNFLPSFSIADF